MIIPLLCYRRRGLMGYQGEADPGSMELALQ